ncbi:MAG TPA: hypothetical protein VJ953_22055 [Saprospiraceae bacterium]|nr:hypothetical protein [Saprospiraceae bacterium]
MPNEKKTELEAFLEGIKTLPKLIIKGLSDAFEDEDHKKVANEFLAPLQEQFNGLSSYLSERMEKSSDQGISEANQLVKLAGGNQMVNSALSISKKLKSIFSRLGLNRIVKEIKKLIIFLLDLFKAPKWIYSILLIIDQILNALFGWDLPETMPEHLSQLEQNYYKELEAHYGFINRIELEE